MTDTDDLAMEYVLGTLRGAERQAFISRLQDDPELAEQVRFWEEQLIGLHHSTRPVAPQPQTWREIESRISPAPEANLSWWQSLFSGRWQWLASSALTLVLCFGLWFSFDTRPPVDPTGYVAVMTNTEGNAVLTAMAPKGEKSLWLQWDNAIQAKPDRDLQLWALSKTDSQPRSLGVFDNAGANRLAIGKAEWGLIKDAEYLILTEEDSGGSALGTPSELVLAKGLCIQFAPDMKQG